MASIITQRVENDEAIVELKDNGIVYVFIKSGTHITVETQRGFLEMYLQVTTSMVPFIFEAGEFVTLSKEAINNAYLLEKESPASASAIIVKNLGQKIIADFYYKFRKTIRPLKVFKTEADAVDWLTQFK